MHKNQEPKSEYQKMYAFGLQKYYANKLAAREADFKCLQVCLYMAKRKN